MVGGQLHGALACIAITVDYANVLPLGSIVVRLSLSRKSNHERVF